MPGDMVPTYGKCITRLQFGHPVPHEAVIVERGQRASTHRCNTAVQIDRIGLSGEVRR